MLGNGVTQYVAPVIFFFFYYGDARMNNHAPLYTKKKLRDNFFTGFLSINNAIFFVCI